MVSFQYCIILCFVQNVLIIMFVNENDLSMLNIKNELSQNLSIIIIYEFIIF